MASQCAALNHSDETRCTEEATNSNGLFCRYHGRRVQGLYAGYKARNKKLDALNGSPPTYLTVSNTPLRNESFKAVEDEATLRELHHFLFKKHALLDRVILARQIHHKLYYSMNLDYGHKAYVDKLTNERFVVLRALERLERRTAEVLYKQAKWFKWVRARQDEEESAREKESEKIKKEAKLFRRHYKEVQRHMTEKRRREDEQRQDAFLDRVYRERVAQSSDEDEDLEWDPIEDAIEDERANFVDLVKHSLWLSPDVDAPQSTSVESSAEGNGKDGSASPAQKENIDTNSKAQTKNAKKRAKTKAKLTSEPKQNGAEDDGTVKVEVNETRAEMQLRLVTGAKYNHMEGIRGTVMRGTLESPVETTGKVVGMPAAEADKILEEIAEIKQFLFCRLLLSQAAVLPNALKADSIDGFLADAEVATADLRDLCLRFEQPSLQEIRDACADFFRGDTPKEAESEEEEEDEVDPISKNVQRFKHKTVPEKWQSKHELTVQQKKKTRRMAGEDEGQTLVDFGTMEDGKFKNTLVRVKVCGRTIWNYPSASALTRSGWLHYSVIAKGSRLFDAIELCRSWEEFWELNVLAIFQYFPSPHWEQWAGDRARLQLLQLGFIPYMQFDKADFFKQDKIDRRARPAARVILQTRNVIGAHIKRNDPVSQRLVQYLAMRTHVLVMMVRDAKTGRVIVKPPEDECWLSRDCVTLLFNESEEPEPEWKVTKEVGEDLFEQISGKKEREWQFGFLDYYEIIVWDLEPGRAFAGLYNTIQETLFKAHRVVEGLDMYRPVEPVVATLHRDPRTYRVRDARPGEWTLRDELKKASRFTWGDMGKGNASMNQPLPPNIFYNDVDAAEDLILFTEELGGKRNAVTGHTDAITSLLEHTGPNWKRFINDIDSSEDEDDYPDPWQEAKATKESPLSKAGSGSGSSNSSNDLAKLPMDDDDSEWTTDDSDDMPCTCPNCKYGRPERCKKPKSRQVLFDTDDGDPETFRLALGFERIEPSSDRDPETDFRSFAEREAAKVFKKQWHEAVTNPDERAQHADVQLLLQEMTLKTFPTLAKHFGLNVLLWLRCHFHEQRVTWRDMERAYASIAVFFPGGAGLGDLSMQASDVLERLTDQNSRARCVPDRRTSRSNLLLPDELWTPINRINKELRRSNTPYHREWDEVARPMIAQWFRAGVIAPAYLDDYESNGTVAIVEEPGRKPDVLLDFRKCKRWNWPTMEDVGRTQTGEPIQEPYSVDLVAKARAYASKHSNARFALLRVWTHSHFYPLTVAPH
ncbi:hypothetical protein LTR17_019415 [Elasticomyces elasticus]|nr:hypothetical protein LTR17_019415 [Elasticomyces elasticus]